MYYIKIMIARRGLGMSARDMGMLIGSKSIPNPVLAKSFHSFRHYSLKAKFKSVSASIDRVGEEDTRESEVTLKIVRRIGAVSIVAVLCLLFWASSMTEPKYEEVVEITDLKKDVRD